MASMCYNERKKLEFIKNPVIAEFLGMASIQILLKVI